jgi:hypothetical protein
MNQHVSETRTREGQTSLWTPWGSQRVPIFQKKRDRMAKSADKPAEAPGDKATKPNVL